MFKTRQFSGRLLAVLGGACVTASAVLAQGTTLKPTTNATPKVIRVQSATPANLPEIPAAIAKPTASAPAPAPTLAVTQPGADTVAHGIVQVNGGCATGNCAAPSCATCKSKYNFLCNRRPSCGPLGCNEVVMPVSGAQPTDPCGPRTGWGPEMPVLPVNRNPGTGTDGLGFADCRVPHVAGFGTGVTFNQCLSNSINICRTPAIMANPNGTFTRMAFERQRLNALTEYFIIYKEEFEEDGKTLTASGVRHLCGIVKRLESCRDLPIQIEIADTNKAIADNRKLAVVDGLMKLGVDAGIAINRVQPIRYCGPRAEPLRYEHIDRVGQAFISGGGGGGGSQGFGGVLNVR